MIWLAFGRQSASTRCSIKTATDVQSADQRLTVRQERGAPLVADLECGRAPRATLSHGNDVAKGPFKNYRYELAAGVQWCSSSRRGSRGDKC